MASSHALWPTDAALKASPLSPTVSRSRFTSSASGCAEATLNTYLEGSPTLSLGDRVSRPCASEADALPVSPRERFAPNFGTEGRGFESLRARQQMYTSRKAGRFAQPPSLLTRRPSDFQAEGHRSDLPAMAAVPTCNMAP